MKGLCLRIYKSEVVSLVVIYESQVDHYFKEHTATSVVVFELSGYI